MEDQLLLEALLHEASECLVHGLVDEAAEILEVAASVEMGEDPFCSFGQTAVPGQEQKNC